MHPLNRDDVIYYIENEIGGYVAENYTIVENAEGMIVKCGIDYTTILTDDNWLREIHNLIGEVEYGMMMEEKYKQDVINSIY